MDSELGFKSEVSGAVSYTHLDVYKRQVEAHAAVRRYALALSIGAIGALVLLALLLGVRRDLAEAVSQPLFWIKVGFVASLFAASLFAALRLSRPGARTEAVPAMLVTPVVALWIIASLTLLDAEAPQRAGLIPVSYTHLDVYKRQG